MVSTWWPWVLSVMQEPSLWQKAINRNGCPAPEYLPAFHGIATGLEVSSQKQVMILYAALALSLNLRIMRGPVKVDGRFDMNPGSSNTLPNNVPNWGTM
ncbi:hypothetical protein AGH21_15430 [Klebsiella oxytoca]|nr:hypothetical protein HR38_02955 [Klebsiella michiganensis]APM31932.1 hypothetical protein AGH21_15430 [Klebsiella oxytoca]MBW5975122.1 hypothetical protein [Klebsiella michiganensis]